jgi:hypothetical protein
MNIKTPLAHLLIVTTFLSLMPTTPAQRRAPRASRNAATSTAEESGLRFRLSEGAERIERTTPNPTAPATRISDQEAQKLLTRLPAIKTDANDVQDFRLRERSLPPPRTGETIRAAFAPPTTNVPPTPARTTAALEVLRFAPEGEVALAPALSVTFSQPMVAVSSQQEAAARVPVTLTPQPKGAWRWLGTQTLMFQPEAEGGRLPMATNYTVTIPAGTTSALGNKLLTAKTFTFATPPPTLKNSYPTGESQPRDAVMFLEFDQLVDARRVLERLRLQSAVGVRLRLATDAEIAADETVKNLAKTRNPDAGSPCAPSTQAAQRATRCPPTQTSRSSSPPARLPPKVRA